MFYRDTLRRIDDNTRRTVELLEQSAARDERMFEQIDRRLEHNSGILRVLSEVLTTQTERFAAQTERFATLTAAVWEMRDDIRAQTQALLAVIDRLPPPQAGDA